MKITNYCLNWINMFRCRQVLRKAKDTCFKYETAICALAKNEEPYLKEWLDHHYTMGFDHIYLIDNNDKPGLKSFLASYLDKALLTIIDFHGIKPSNQSAAYEYCLANYAKETRWMAFIDIDEFVMLKKDSDIRSFLSHYMHYPAILMNWVMYGSNNQVFKRQEGVKERFPLPATEGQAIESMNKCFKSIIQTMVYTSFTDCVMRAHRWNFPVFTSRGKLVMNETSINKSEYITLNHYYTKSYEEFLHRCKRGETIGGNKRYIDFFNVNPLSMREDIDEYNRNHKNN